MDPSPPVRPAAFLEEAEALLGERGFTRDPELVGPWLTDWRGRFTGRALALGSPASTAEVAALVRMCGEHRVAIVPQGGNSGMSGGATPDESGSAIILSLRRLRRVRRLDVASREVTCEAGVILQSLHEAAAAEGLRFPLTLGGKGSATIGGLVSTNAGGTQVLRHGTMRAQVLGLEAVMADGSVFDALAHLKKDNRGFDLKQLLIGSEGTLGIVTAATLRLLPAVAERRVLWAGLADIRDARRLLLHAEELAGDALEGFEVMPRHSLAAVLAHLPHARTPLGGSHEWHALIELVADREGATRLPALAGELLESAFEKGLVEDATIAQSEAQSEAFWLLRDEIAPAERALGPAMQHDVSVPVARMADFVAEAVPRVERAFPGTRAVAFGHLGDGNVHFHVLAPEGTPRGAWEESEGKEISAFVHDLVTDWQGSISAEHGIGQLKRDELARLSDPVRLELMRRIKSALDPLGLLNPGKLVPPCPACLRGPTPPPKAPPTHGGPAWRPARGRRCGAPSTTGNPGDRPMASAPTASLPILYKNLVPLNSRDHGSWHARVVDRAPWVAGQHAIPLTVEEFPLAQREFPIVFSQGEKPVPLALLGLNEGVNTFFDDAGGPIGEIRYVPAYIRRYPFLLARIDQSSDSMSLCFDPTTDVIGEFEDGHALFDAEGQPTEHTKGLLQFCERFEEAGRRTQAFVEELLKADLLMDGEVSIQRADQPDRPYIYRGFKMVNQEKLRDARGDQLRKWNENGLLPALYAHLHSLDVMRVIFGRQEQQGKGPSAAAGSPASGPALASASGAAA